SGVSTIRVASPLELEARLYQALVELGSVPAEPPRLGRADVMGSSVAVPLGRRPVEGRGRAGLRTPVGGERGPVRLAGRGGGGEAGRGGVGKSTIAAELARRLQSSRQVWWVSASDASSLLGGLITVARRLAAPDVDLDALATRAADAPDRLWALPEGPAAGP